MVEIFFVYRAMIVYSWNLNMMLPEVTCKDYLDLFLPPWLYTDRYLTISGIVIPCLGKMFLMLPHFSFWKAKNSYEMQKPLWAKSKVFCYFWYNIGNGIVWLICRFKAQLVLVLFALLTPHFGISFPASDRKLVRHDCYPLARHSFQISFLGCITF